MNEDTKARELVLSRLIHGPRKLVFEAYTELRHLEQWFGPDGFSTTTRSFELRPGGVWLFTMHGPDGVDYPNCIRFQEITPPERLVYVHGESADDPSPFVSTITFAEREGGTEVTMRALFATKAQLDEKLEKYGALEGGRQHLGRLDAWVRART